MNQRLKYKRLNCKTQKKTKVYFHELGLGDGFSDITESTVEKKIN